MQQDVDLVRGRVEVRRSRHLWTYDGPKTASTRRTVQLFSLRSDGWRR